MSANAGDRKSIRAAEKAARLSAAARADVTREIMSSAPGRAWMWDLLGSCHIFSPTFIPSAPDRSAFAEGERNIGLRLMADIMMHCPDQYIQAQREANERSDLNDSRLAPAAPERRGSEVPDGRDSGRVDSDDAPDGDEDPRVYGGFDNLLTNDQLRVAAEAGRREEG